LPLRHVDPDQAIALGAAVAAGMKARDASLEEIILTDVCPYTLGTAVSRVDERGNIREGYFHPIIQRNSTVPVSREDVFSPVEKGQRQLQVEIYQGENPLVANNVRLGQINVPVDPRRAPHENLVTVRFTYDVDGLLQVEATVEATGRKLELVVEQNPGLLSPEDIRHRLDALAKLRIHPRNQQENVAILARAERLFAEYVHLREPILAMIVEFRGLLERQDAVVIDDARKRLARDLDEIEGVIA
jgi:molecular chaperone HscC